MDVQQAINLQLVRSFANLNISFGFPTQTLHLNEMRDIAPAAA
jgi:hypothetical protein